MMSQKRKSNSIEGENIPTAALNALHHEQSIDMHATVKKSKLPAPRSIAHGPVRSAPKASTLNTSQSQEPPLEKRKAATEASSSERTASVSLIKTPNGKGLKGPQATRATPLAKATPSHGHGQELTGQLQLANFFKVKRDLEALAVKKMTTTFDELISTKEETIQTIQSSLKSKKGPSYMNGDKMKKLETVVKETKEQSAKLLRDVQVVKAECAVHEDTLVTCIQSFLRESEDLATAYSRAANTENRMRRDLVKQAEDIESLSSQLEESKAVTAKLSIEVHQQQINFQVVDQQLKTSEAAKLYAEQTKAQLEKELMESRFETSAQATSLAEQWSQKIESATADYKAQIAALRADMQRVQSDAERSSGEKAEIDKVRAELKEEQVRLQSLLREAESANRRNEAEVQRLNQDLTSARDHLHQKEGDLRVAFQSISDLHRQAKEDKDEKKTELSHLLERIKTLEEERLLITADLAAKREAYEASNREIQQYREANALTGSKLSQLEAEYFKIKDSAMHLEVERELRCRCEVREEAERRERIAASSQLLAVQSEFQNERKELEETMRREIAAVQATCSEVTSQRDSALADAKANSEIILGLRSEITQLESSLSSASANVGALQELSKATGELEILRQRLRESVIVKDLQVGSYNQKIAELEEKVRQGEIHRRKLHNLVQELRGNVRVFARVRPYLPNDGLNMEHLPDPSIKVNNDGTHIKAIKKMGNNDDKFEETMFSFDRVFGPSCSQEHIFNEVSEFVQSALDGYNVCLFSYGQTGSGKTHTMQGCGNGNMRGIIPRAMEQVGHYKTDLEGKGWKYEMEVSFVEIYNETVQDLLRNSPNDDLKHEIKKDAAGNVYVSDVTMISVDPNNSEQIDSIVELAARHRSVGQTAMNERSSRSHSVFALHLRATNESEGIVLKGMLNLVDLAGSERLDRSGVSGARMQESVAINKSLSALTDVFVAIGNKQNHIPFRNSKLTYLLQPALSGDGKTLMMVNLSPTEDSYYESLCSLRFASQVNQCELGKPRRQLKDAGTTGTTSGSSALACSSSSSGNVTPVTLASKAGLTSIGSTKTAALAKSSSTPIVKKIARK